MSTATLDEAVTPEADAPISVLGRNDLNDSEIRLQEAAGRIALSHIGFRVQRGRPRYQRRFRMDQVSKAVESFGAERTSVSMSKKLFDAREPAVKRFRAVYSEITALVENPEYTLPCPKELGVRLIKRGKVNDVEQQMTLLQAKLQSAAHALQNDLPLISARQRTRLGTLYDAQDYQFDAEDACYVRWDFPPVHLVDDSLANE